MEASKYFVIKMVCTDDGFEGYVTGVVGGNPTLIEIICADVKTWDTYGEAHNYAWKNKLNESSNHKLYILDSGDLFDIKTENQTAKRLETEVYYMVNQGGWKLFFSVIRRKYFWDDKPHLYCVWFDMESATKALEKFNKDYPQMKIEIKTLKK